jgi:poly-beta-1,6-N-acetyl-D-glucosamine synthase
MNVSVGVMVHNEHEELIDFINSLIDQKTEKVNIKEVIFVSSGSDKATQSILLNWQKSKKNFKFIFQRERKGKYSAINLFLKRSKSKILILSSSDIVLSPNCIEHLCLPLINKKIGIVASRPISINKNDSLIHKVEKLQWDLHHQISLISPKFGELIAFRKVFYEVSPTAVDEEEIAYLIKSSGYTFFYEQKATVYNKGPDSFMDFLVQRRRIYAGHLELKKRNNYSSSSLSTFRISVLSLSFLRFNNFFIFVSALLLELLARTLGYFDYLTGKKYYIWPRKQNEA